MTDDEDMEELLSEQLADRRRRKPAEEQAPAEAHPSMGGTACFYCGNPGRAKDRTGGLIIRSCQRCRNIARKAEAGEPDARKVWVLQQIIDRAEAARLKAMSENLKAQVRGQANYGKR